MDWFRAARLAAVIGLTGGLIAAPPLFGALARSKPVPVVEAPPPPPPPAGPVALPARTVADAAAFQAYLERVGGASPAFTDGLSVAHALKDAGAYEPRALIRDAVAYGAVAALEDTSFVAALRAAGDSPDNRRAMVGYLMADPGYAFLFKGADHAAGLAREAIGEAGLKLYDNGRAVRQASYSVQHQPWSKVDVADRPTRLAATESAGQQPLPDAADHVDALEHSISGAAPLPVNAAPLAPPYTPLVAHAVQLAAIAALGEVGDEDYDRLATLASDESTGACLHMAKLNLYQCLAVARPNYEDIFCDGQHAMTDTGACLVKNAGLNLPPEPAPPAPPPAPVARRKTRRG